MASGDSINVKINFLADTSQAESALSRLSTSLRNISSQVHLDTGGARTAQELNDASEAAIRLRQNLASAMNMKTGQLDLTQFNRSMSQSGMSLEKYAKTLTAIGPTGQRAFQDLSTAILNSTSPLRQSNALLDNMWDSLKRTAQWQISSSIVHGFTGALQTAYHYAQDLNESLNNIRIVTGNSTEYMAKFAQQANKTAKALSSTTLDYTNAALIYAQQGLGEKEIEERTAVTLKMANVTGDSAQVVSDQLTAIWNNFNKAGDESAEHYADVMTALGAATASSTDEIAQGLSQFAAIADTIGLSYDHAAAALATVTARTRQSANVVGTAFRTIFSRIEGLSLGETLEDGTDLNKYSEAVATIGVDIKDQNGELKDMDTIMDEIGAKWQTLSKDQQVALAQTVGGVRQYTQFMAIFDNWDYFKENLDVAKNSAGELEKQNEIYAESWQGALDRLRAAWESVYNDIIDDDFFITLTNGLTKFVEGIDKVIDGLGGLKGLLPGVIVLVNQLFGEKIATTAQTVAYNIQGLTRAGRSKQASHDAAIYEQMRDVYTNLNTGGATDKNAGQAFKSGFDAVAQTQRAVISNYDKMTKSEQEYTAFVMDGVKAAANRNVELAQTADEAARIRQIEQENVETWAFTNQRWTASNKFNSKFYKQDELDLLDAMGQTNDPAQFAQMNQFANTKWTRRSVDADGNKHRFSMARHVADDLNDVFKEMGLDHLYTLGIDDIKNSTPQFQDMLKIINNDTEGFNILYNKMQGNIDKSVDYKKLMEDASNFAQRTAGKNQADWSQDDKDIFGKISSRYEKFSGQSAKGMDAYGILEASRGELRDQEVELNATASGIAKTYGIEETAVRKLIAARREERITNDEFQDSLEKLRQTSAEANENIEGLAHTATTFEKLQAATNAVMGLSMAFSSVKNTIDGFNDTSLTASDQIMNIVTSLSSLGIAVNEVNNSGIFQSLQAMGKKSTVMETIFGSSDEAGVIQSQNGFSEASQDIISAIVGSGLEGDDEKNAIQAKLNELFLIDPNKLTEENKGKMQEFTSKLAEMLGNTSEPLTDEVKEKLQGQISEALSGFANSGASKTFSFKTMFSGLVTSAKSALTAIGGFIMSGPGVALIAIAALAATTYLVVKSIRKPLDDAKKESENAHKAADAAKEAYKGISNELNNLKSSVQSIKDLTEATNKLTAGSQEWKENLLEINSQVLELLDKYPELADYITNNNGMLGISDEGYDKILDSMTEKAAQAQEFYIKEQQRAIRADVEYESMQKGYNAAYNPSGTKTNLLSTDQMFDIADAMAHNPDIQVAFDSGDLSKAQAALEGVTDLSKDQIQALMDNSDEMDYLKTTVAEANAQLEVLNAQEGRNLVEASGASDESKQVIEGSDIASAIGADIVKNSSGSSIFVKDEKGRVGVVRSGDHILDQNGNTVTTDTDETVPVFAEEGLFATSRTDLGEETLKQYLEKMYPDLSDAKIKELVRKANFTEGKVAVGGDVGDVDYNTLLDFWESQNALKNADNAQTNEDLNNFAETLKQNDTGENTLEAAFARLLATGDASELTADQFKKIHDAGIENTEEALVASYLDNNGLSGLSIKTNQQILDLVKSITGGTYNEASAQEKQLKDEKELADAYGTTVSNVKEKYEELKKLDKYQNASTSTLKEAVAAELKQEQALQKTAGAWADNSEKIKEWVNNMDNSESTAKKVKEFAQDLADVFGVEGLDDSWVRKYFKDIEDWLNETDPEKQGQKGQALAFRAQIELGGTEEAKNELQKKLEAEPITITADNGQVLETLNSTESALAWLYQQYQDGKITIDAEGRADFSQVLSQLYAAGATASQVGSILQAIGTSKTDLHVFTSDGKDIGSYVEMQREARTSEKDLTDFLVKSGYTIRGKTNLTGFDPSRFKVPSATGGSGGGGSSQKDKKDTSEINKNYTLEKSLESLTDKYDKLDKAKDRAYGEKRLKIIAQETQNLKEQRKIQEQLLKDYRSQEAQERQWLQGKGFTFDADGVITNYTSRMTQFYNNFNNSSRSDSDEKVLTELEDHIKKYEDLQGKVRDTTSSIADAINAEIDSRLEGITYRIEFKTDEYDEEKSKGDYLTERLEKQSKISLAWWDASQKSIDVADEKLKLHREALSQFFTTFTAEEIAMDATLQKELLDLQSKVRESEKDAFEERYDAVNKFVDKIKEINEALEDPIDKLKNMADILSTIADINEALGNDDLAVRSSLTRDMMSVSANQLGLQGKYLKNIEDEIKLLDKLKEGAHLTTDESKVLTGLLGIDIERASRDAIGDLAETAKKELQDKADELRADILSNWADLLKTLQEQYEAFVDAAYDKAQKSLYQLGLEGTIDALSSMKEVQDQFVENNEKIYELNKLNRNLMTQLNKLDNVAQKQKIRDLMEDVNKFYANNVKLSRYELQNLQAQYDLRVAEIALEDAQNAKSQVRLTRDNNGNWGYMYTANTEALDKAQQEYEDKLYAYQKLQTDTVNEKSESMLQTMQEALSKASEIQKNMNGLDENSEDYQIYARQLELIKNQYVQLLSAQGADLAAALQFAGPDFSDTSLGILTSTNSVEEFLSSFTNKFTETVELVSNEQDTQVANFLKVMNEVLGTSFTTINELAEYVKGMTSQAQKDVQVSTTVAVDSFKEAEKGLDELADKARKVIDQINEYFNKTFGDGSLYYTLSGDNVDYMAEAMKARDAGDMVSAQKILEARSEKIRKTGNTKQAVSAEWLKNNGFVFTDYGYYDIVQRQYQDIAKFDTGGYTGDWDGSNGRLAMLHEKELVLNADDTKNVLKIVDLANRVISKLDNSNLWNMFTPLSAIKTNAAGQVLQQEVHIDASFPNATDHNEIEQAFENIVNLASQYANRK